MSEITSPLNIYVGRTVNQIYSWNNNTTFYSLASPYLLYYYTSQVRLWDYWYTGYVPSFHSDVWGIVPSGIGAGITGKLADLIYGEGIVYESTDKNNPNNKSIDFVTNKFEDLTNFKRQIKDAILKSCALGNALLKINCDDKNELWVDTIAGNRFFCDIDARGRVVHAKCYVNIYTVGASNNYSDNQSYGLVEERFYKEEENFLTGEVERKPYVTYKIYRLSTVANTFSPPPAVSLSYTDLPRKVKEAFKHDYNDIMLNEELYLPLRDLGCYLIKHTEYVSVMPNIKMGESCLAKILNLLMLYDTIYSEGYTELYVSRAKALVPYTMKAKNAVGGAYEGFDDVIYSKVPNISDKEQSPVVFAPQMRTEQFSLAREDCCKQIASIVGIAVNSIFSDIRDSSKNITTKQIASEDSSTDLYVTNKRIIFLQEVNRCLKTCLLYYGFVDDVNIRFTPPASRNRTQLVESTIKLKESGLISEYQALKDLNPTFNENQINNELNEIHKTIDTASNEDINA